MSGHLNNEDSEFVSHLPCEKCGSSDANSLYSDGHTYCFSCNTYANAYLVRTYKKRGGGYRSK